MERVRITGHGYDCNNQSQDKRGRLRKLHTTPSPPINTSAEHKIGQYSVLPYRSKTYPGRLAHKIHQGQTCAVWLYHKTNDTSTKKIPQVNKIQSTVNAHCKTIHYNISTID
ncbi:Uncharacterized protein FWK35_00023222, partial [Aphis craccivora]